MNPLEETSRKLCWKRQLQTEDSLVTRAIFQEVTL
jgi:hypothetical protein